MANTTADGTVGGCGRHFIYCINEKTVDDTSEKTLVEDSGFYPI